MNYIYDVLLNFKDVLYDFYEWNKDDEIQHIRRIPVIRVSSEVLYDLKENRVSIDAEFLNRFLNKTEVFQRKSIKTIGISLIFTDTKDALAVLFSKGESLKKSSMLLDEMEDLLDISKTCMIQKFEYKILHKEKRNPFRTRKEEEIIDYVVKELNKMNQKEKLEYLYFECYNVKPENVGTIKKDLKDALYKDFNIFSKRLYDILKLTSIKK